MKQQDEYNAKEAFTFPLFCLVCMASFIYWGCTDGWRVGVIIGTSFVGIITLVYIFKYLRFGRDFLRIDDDGIEIKYWKKITILKWSEIKKCEVYYRTAHVSVSLFERDLMIVVKSEKEQKQYIFVSLSGKYCRNKSVIEAIERFGDKDVYDCQSSHRQNKYLAGILLVALIGILLVFIISIIRDV